MHSSLIHLFESPEQPVREGGVVVPILQMWSLRPGEVNWLASEIPAKSFCVTTLWGLGRVGTKQRHVHFCLLV